MQRTRKMKKKLFTTLASIFMAASLSGCADRNDDLLEIDPSYQQKCMTFSPETDIETQTNYDVSEKVKAAEYYLNTLQRGVLFAADLKNNDNAMCIGTAGTDPQEIRWDKSLKTWFIGDAVPADIMATEMVWGDVNNTYNKYMKSSERLVPADALLYSRAITAHKINVELAIKYHMLGQSFNHSAWQKLENQRYMGPYAQKFREILLETNNVQDAHTEVLIMALDNIEQYANNDGHFLRWYDTHLHDKDVPTPDLCLGFDGSMSACITMETQPPAITTAASTLSADSLVNLSAQYMPTPYLDSTLAQKLLEDEHIRQINSSTEQLFQRVLRNADACCSTQQRESRSSTFGIGARGFGFNIF